MTTKYSGETMYCEKCQKLVTPKPPIDYKTLKKGDKEIEVITGFCPYCGSKVRKIIA